MLSSVELEINHIFSNLEGGLGVLPRKILNIKKAREAISDHFVRTILPSVNDQFHRILLPLIKKIRHICTLSVLHIVCINLGV